MRYYTIGPGNLLCFFVQIALVSYDNLKLKKILSLNNKLLIHTIPCIFLVSQQDFWRL